MNRFLITLGVCAMLGGCGSCETTPDSEIDLAQAKKEIAEGRVLRGLAMFCDALERIEGKSDAGAGKTRGDILLSAFDCRAADVIRKATNDERASVALLVPYLESDKLLLSAAAEEWIAVISGRSTADMQREGARSLARILKLKIEQPALRCGGLSGQTPFNDAAYRRLMLESLVEFERYLLGRSEPDARNGTSLADALKLLGGALLELAGTAKVNAAVAGGWRDLEELLRAEAGLAIRKPGDIVVKPETYNFVEAGDRQKNDASDATAAAAREVVGGDPKRAVPAIEASLRRYLFMRETTRSDRPLLQAMEAIDFWSPQLVKWAHQ